MVAGLAFSLQPEVGVAKHVGALDLGRLNAAEHPEQMLDGVLQPFETPASLHAVAVLQRLEQVVHQSTARIG
jgi:hypothetical protein